MPGNRKDVRSVIIGRYIEGGLILHGYPPCSYLLSCKAISFRNYVPKNFLRSFHMV